MTTDQDLQAAGRRLAILQCLKDDADYSINDALLGEMLSYRGHGVSRSVLKGDLAWLEQQGLLATRDLPGCTVAVLRDHGVDVAGGTAHVPGVARPRPQ